MALPSASSIAGSTVLRQRSVEMEAIATRQRSRSPFASPAPVRLVTTGHPRVMSPVTVLRVGSSPATIDVPVSPVHCAGQLLHQNSPMNPVIRSRSSSPTSTVQGVSIEVPVSPVRSFSSQLLHQSPTIRYRSPSPSGHLTSTRIDVHVSPVRQQVHQYSPMPIHSPFTPSRSPFTPSRSLITNASGSTGKSSPSASVTVASQSPFTPSRSLIANAHGSPGKLSPTSSGTVVIRPRATSPSPPAPWSSGPSISSVKAPAPHPLITGSPAPPIPRTISLSTLSSTHVSLMKSASFSQFNVTL